MQVDAGHLHARFIPQAERGTRPGKRQMNVKRLSVVNMRPLLGYCGIALTGLCAVAVVLAMTGVTLSLNQQLMHQSVIRWLAEGAIAGMLLAAFGFWSSD